METDQLLRALLDGPLYDKGPLLSHFGHNQRDWPFDYEFAQCYWCDVHRNHAETCPFRLATEYLAR